VSDREWKHLQEPYLSNFQTQRRNYRKRIAQLIETGIQKKEILPIDSATAVLIMLHAISGIESWHRSKKRISARELEDNMLTILVGGLRKNH
jgi:DeoR/GlpR family transcriptional regulator of sugar metabolism